AQQRDRQTAQVALFSGEHLDDPCSNELSEEGPCLSLRNLTSHEFVDEARLAHPTVVVSEPCDEGEGALPEIRLVGMQHLVDAVVAEEHGEVGIVPGPIGDHFFLDLPQMCQVDARFAATPQAVDQYLEDELDQVRMARGEVAEVVNRAILVGELP